MQITINNEVHELAGDPNRSLLWTLRDELGLTGSKFGCGAGICGACTVHVDGVALRSCITPLTAVEDKAITTIEGLATENTDGSLTLHPVQQAFIDEQVPQCGWCMSGQIMTAAAFLTSNPAPSSDEVVNAMGQNYCRCGCYVRIKSAVEKAASMGEV
ncbi:MAG: (2Fe-2S)-binding protein [Chloroflexota bacterium]